MDVEDDLGPWGGPLQVASHPDPQLVDVGVLAVVRGDGEGVWDGKQLQHGGQGRGVVRWEDWEYWFAVRLLKNIQKLEYDL